MKIQLNPLARDLSRNQVMRELPENDPRREILDGFKGSSVNEMDSDASDRIRYQSGTPASLARTGAGAATVAAVGSVFAAVALGSLLPLAGAVALGGLASAAFWGGNKLEKNHREGLEGQRDVLHQVANQKAETLLTVEGDRVINKAFLDDFAFKNPQEINRSGSAELLERKVTVAGNQTVTMVENASAKEVTMSWDDKSVKLPGTLVLPTIDKPEAQIVIDNGDDNIENLSKVVYSFDKDGKFSVGASSDWYSDDVGFSYLDQVTAGKTENSQINQDGTIYIRGGWDHDWYVIKTPELPESPSGKGEPGRLKLPKENFKLHLTMPVSHAKELEPSILSPLKVGKQPLEAEFYFDEDSTPYVLKNQDGQLSVERGDYRKTFTGKFDSQGNIEVETPNGKLTQVLENYGAVKLIQTVPSGRLEVTQYSENNTSASHIDKEGEYSTAVVKIKGDGNYEVLYSGGQVNLQAPIPRP